MVRGDVLQGQSTGYCLYLQGKIHGLVGPNSWDTENELFLAELKVLSHSRRCDDGKSMLVNSTDEVGSDIDRILRKGLAIGREAGSGQVLGHGLVWIQQELDSMYGRIAPIDLATPFEF